MDITMSEITKRCMEKRKSLDHYQSNKLVTESRESVKSDQSWLRRETNRQKVTKPGSGDS